MNQDFRKLIFPLLLDLCFIDTKKLLEYYKVVPEMEEAGIVIIPVDIGYFYREKKQADLFKMIDAARKLDKPVWAYSAGDVGKTIEDVFNFRFGGFHSKMDRKTFILPAFFQDPYKSYIEEGFFPIEKNKKPRIGFVGHANGSKIKYLKEYVHFLKRKLRNLKIKASDDQPFFPSGVIRNKYLRKLENNDKIATGFIYRTKYRAGARTKKERFKTTVEFYDNMKNNPYTFCMRGGGNFSVRLYETLAMGRIPVLIDTDSRLPLPWKNWESHAIITSYENLEHTLLKFHNSISPEEFKEFQWHNRNFWLTHLTREGYFIQMHHYFLNQIR